MLFGVLRRSIMKALQMEEAFMISSDHVRLMAAYNKWQNSSIFEAADTLTDEARQADRGAFFKSIHATLSHVLWADELWMSRFTTHPAPDGGIPESSVRYRDWAMLKKVRTAMDKTMIQWAATISPSDLNGDLSWFSGAMGREVSRPRWLLITHLFNHGTHHRGQVHAMLTAEGAKPDDTDIPFMPGLD